MISEHLLKHWVMFLGATVIQFYSGWEFYKSSWTALKNRLADMNLLVSIGTMSAYLYSVVVMFFPEAVPQQGRHLYFEASASVITFVLFGRFLEAKVRLKATGFMKNLLNLKPRKATIIADGKQFEVDTDSILKGDIVLVKPGETVPVDGVVIEGMSELDKSSITGESKPEFVKEGDMVVSGSINQLGVLKIKATKNAKDSFINQIINLILQAQTRKPQIGRLADRITAYFVPFVLIISIFTFDVWFLTTNSFEYSLVSMVSVLVIACPCALGLATPIAVVATVGRAAQEGILIKNPEAVEKVETIKTVVFDKTGTLTQGRMKVVDSLINDKNSACIIKSLEEYVDHPISKAVVQFLSDFESCARFSSVKVIPGEGVVGTVDGSTVFAGNHRLLKRFNIAVDEESGEFYRRWSERGATVIFCCVADRLVAIFAVSDTLRPEAFEVIHKLKSTGYKTAMLTGDSEKVATNIASTLGIDMYKAGLTPDEKYREIFQLRTDNGGVMFVGDGINDAPAMSVADVGVAVEGGTDIAKESADFVLLKNDLRTLLKVISLSKHSLRTIKQNLLWAYFYNIIGIPLAAGLFYPFFGILLSPMYAGLAMSLSSVSVVINSLRLKTVKL